MTWGFTEDWLRDRLARRGVTEADWLKLIGSRAQPLSKFHNVPTDGEDSKAQAKRLAELRLLNRGGHIRGLARQVEYLLVPRQTECGELVEREILYVADFQYEERGPDGWRLVVEDFKGYRTRDYVMKRKLMLKIHGIRIRETWA